MGDFFMILRLVFFFAPPFVSSGTDSSATSLSSSLSPSLSLLLGIKGLETSGPMGLPRSCPTLLSPD
jgi:hypothetical protein